MRRFNYEFSVKDANQLLNGDISEAFQTIKELTKVDDVDDVKEEMLMKLNKKQLVESVLELLNALSFCDETINGACDRVDELQTSVIKLQKDSMEQKDELLRQKDEQLQSVQSTVKTELRSYCEAAKQGVASSSITAAQVKTAVKTVVAEEDRTRNIMLFGVAEEENLEVCAAAIFEQVQG